jgi:hypothetical protein
MRVSIRLVVTDWHTDLADLDDLWRDLGGSD